MVDKHFNRTTLEILNELSWILESMSCTYTGEAKDAISDLRRQLEQSTYPLQTNLLQVLEEVHQLLQEHKVARAAQTLSPSIRTLWNEVLS